MTVSGSDLVWPPSTTLPRGGLYGTNFNGCAENEGHSETVLAPAMDMVGFPWLIFGPKMDGEMQVPLRCQSWPDRLI